MKTKQIEGHVIPKEDSRAHTLTGRCRCKPESERVADNVMYTHNAYDEQRADDSGWTAAFVDRRVG
jgi:hypothetical protein